MIKAISFDAAGTLIHLAEPVGHGYARVAANFDIALDPAATSAAFRSAWLAAPTPSYRNGPAPDGDRAWWRSLVDSVLDLCLIPDNRPPHPVRSAFFDALYDHYALPDSWRLFPEVTSVLDRLAARPIPLIVLSNFDPRLRRILDGLHISHFFQTIIISSEVGFYKPHPSIFQLAAHAAQLPPASCLHVGDDPVADLGGARSAGFHSLLIGRPNSHLDSIFDHPNFPT